jgi:hypothetical protein
VGVSVGGWTVAVRVTVAMSGIDVEVGGNCVGVRVVVIVENEVFVMNCVLILRWSRLFRQKNETI